MNDLKPIDTTRISSFRQNLRTQTRPEHDATEAMFEPFLRDPARKLGWYLSAQRSGLAAICTQPAAKHALCAEIVPDLIARLDHDLADMGRSAVDIPTEWDIAPVACDYIVLGSRLGTEVIRRRIYGPNSNANIPTYFQTPVRPDLWRAHCDTLDHIDPMSEKATQIIIDARRGFDLFKRAAHSQQD